MIFIEDEDTYKPCYMVYFYRMILQTAEFSFLDVL